MITIYKYPIRQTEKQIVMTPGLIEQGVLIRFSEQVMHVDIQGDTICIWAMVDTETSKQERRIIIVGTGRDATEITCGYEHIGTVKMGPYVWHIFA
jgi:hypothetical protein